MTEVLSWWAILLTLPAILLSLFNWRVGLFAMLIVAFLQDPARKMEMDQPVYFTLLAGMVLAAVYLRAQAPRAFWPSQIPGWTRYLRLPSIVFVLLLAVQAGLSIVRYGNPIIAAIGGLSYLAPLPALLVGYHFALRTGPRGIRRWMAAYLICALVVLPTIAIEYAGVDWATLGQVGEGFEMYQDEAVLTAHSGFFRASETAAWHTATTVCFLLVLSSMRKLSRKQIALAVCVIVALLTIGTLTGRRKIFVEIVIFMTGYVSLLLLFGKGGLKMAGAVFLGGLISFGALWWWVVAQPSDPAMTGASRFSYYAQRSSSVGSDVSERFLGLGLDSVEWAMNRYGWLGGGLGIASQGAQHFGGGAEVYGGSGEGGLGKLTAELGVPGLLVGIWFVIAAARYAWLILVNVSRRSASIARLAYALLAFLLANLAVFIVATQVFGDVFVLIILGLLAGFFAATPVLAEREMVQPAAARRPSGTRPQGAVPAVHSRV